jgi:hypothetical protein
MDSLSRKMLIAVCFGLMLSSICFGEAIANKALLPKMSADWTSHDLDRCFKYRTAKLPEIMKSKQDFLGLSYHDVEDVLGLPDIPRTWSVAGGPYKRFYDGYICSLPEADQTVILSFDITDDRVTKVYVSYQPGHQVMYLNEKGMRGPLPEVIRDYNRTGKRLIKTPIRSASDLIKEPNHH